uniref:Uncharacterized protein n=1 Tax=Tanacetum cinerariifolium TaxID=118510 RepID=A0A6L2N687_TANCI|nr:hypothetical protein [Tanacetum cinerariifolium]GEW28409.1 hypothetical protein [Tanacetum cinerariifolium]
MTMMVVLGLMMDVAKREMIVKMIPVVRDVEGSGDKVDASEGEDGSGGEDGSEDDYEDDDSSYGDDKDGKVTNIEEPHGLGGVDKKDNISKEKVDGKVVVYEIDSYTE